MRKEELAKIQNAIVIAESENTSVLSEEIITEVNSSEIAPKQISVALEMAKEFSNDPLTNSNTMVVATEFDDNSESLSPTLLTVASTVALNEKTADTIGEWAPIVYLPKGEDKLEIAMPEVKIENVVDGRVQETVRVSDLDIKDIVGDASPRYEPNVEDENEAMFLPESFRPVPGTTKRKGSFLISGKTISLKEAAPGYKDITGGELGRTDIFAPKTSIDKILVRIQKDDKTEFIVVDAAKVISKDNFSEGAKTGNKNNERLDASFIIGITKDTLVMVDGASIDAGTGKASEILPDVIADGEIIVLRVEVSLEIDRVGAKLRTKGSTVSVIKCMVNGSEVAYVDGHPFNDVEVDAPALELNIFFTNTNNRHVGNFMVEDTYGYVITTAPKDIITNELPEKADDARPGDTVYNAIARQSYKIRMDMTKEFFNKLEGFESKLQNSIILQEPMGIPNEQNFRSVYIKRPHTLSNVTLMRTSEQSEVQRVALQDKIEAVAKELVRESGWRAIRFLGASGYVIKVECHLDIDLENFTMKDGTSVQITKSELCPLNKLYIVPEAIGGPVVHDIKILAFSNIVAKHSVTYAGRRRDGNASYKSITTKPEFDVLFKLPILGVIELN